MSKSDTVRWQVRGVTQEAPASLFYAVSLTKNAVGVFAHGKLRSPIFCTGRNQRIEVPQAGERAFVIIEIEIEQRYPRAQLTASVFARGRGDVTCNQLQALEAQGLVIYGSKCGWYSDARSQCVAP